MLFFDKNGLEKSPLMLGKRVSVFIRHEMDRVLEY